MVTIYRTETITGQTIVIDPGAILTDAVDSRHHAVGTRSSALDPFRTFGQSVKWRRPLCPTVRNGPLSWLVGSPNFQNLGLQGLDHPIAEFGE